MSPAVSFDEVRAYACERVGRLVVDLEEGAGWRGGDGLKIREGEEDDDHENPRGDGAEANRDDHDASGVS